MSYRAMESSAAVMRATLLVAVAACALNAGPGTTPEPRITSVSPAAATAGSTITLRIRGTKLEDPRGLWSSTPGLSGASVRSMPEEAGEAWIEAQVAIAPDAAVGPHSIRVITANGLSNQLPLEVTREQVWNETQTTRINGPAVLAGTLNKPGETDTYGLEVRAGETWSFEAKAGTPAFDPALAIYEPSGSWFDSQRLNRIAFNDEPLHFPGLSAQPKLTYRFEKPGKYAVAVSGFAGQGGPDCVYVLKVTRGTAATPPLHPEPPPTWEERQFTRVLSPDWLERIAARGASGSGSPQQLETWEAAEAESPEAPSIAPPGVVHGRISRPAQTQAVGLRIEKPEELVLEVETPKATMPRFNPVVRLLDAGGNEMVTNVYTKRNNNGLYMMKMIQAKATVALRSPGQYRLEIRDITTDCAGDDFEYKVIVRRKVPHLGKVAVSEPEVNVRPGSTATLHLTAEREEDFAGTVAFEAEGLPTGVSLVSGVENPVEKPPLPNGGKLERYTPRSQSSVLLLSAAADAPATAEPVIVRLFARPVIDGKLGNRILVRELPLFVAAGGTS